MLIYDAGRNVLIYDHEEEIDEFLDFLESTPDRQSRHFIKFYMDCKGRACLSSADRLADLIGGANA